MAQISAKQIAYIERLASDRWQYAVAEDMGCSPSAALRRATSADASRTIDRLLKAAGKTSAQKTERITRTAYGDYI